jgi:hypothetical protein
MTIRAILVKGSQFAIALAFCGLTHTPSKSQTTRVEFTSCPDASAKVSFIHTYFPSVETQTVRYTSAITSFDGKRQHTQSIDELRGPCKVINERNWACGGEVVSERLSENSTMKFFNRKHQVIDGIYTFTPLKRVGKDTGCEILWRQIK